MDLMTNVTSVSALKNKYRNFSVPSHRINVEGKDIKEKLNADISHLSVELTAEYEASGATFTVVNQYQEDQTDFDSKGVYKELQLGAKVEIMLGYISVETVFTGLITEVEYNFNGDSSPSITVSCMDAKCLLMKIQRLEVRKEKKVSQVVTALLSEQPISEYISGKDVSLTTPEVSVIQLNMESDYNFIVKQAQYFGCEFFIIAGKAYFRNKASMTSPIFTISPNDGGMLSAKLSLRGAGLVDTLEVVGINPENDQAITVSNKLPGKFSEGSTAKKMLSKTQRTYFDSNVTSVDDAKKRAAILSDSIARDFGVLEVNSVGNPEIVPGRFIKVEGLSKTAKQSYYITKVLHEYDSEMGFTTNFEGRVMSL